VSPPDPRWEAVRSRDVRADGSFYYSVRTTGVYCRPSCGSRLPRVENVAFHATRGDAERAGFRPCRRCRPDGGSPREQHEALVADLCRFIESRLELPTLAELARRAGLSPHHTHRLFKATTGVTPRAYASARRGVRLRGALEGSGTVTAAMYDAGFGSSGRFYEQAPDLLGMTPTEYRDGARGLEITFAVGRCSLGRVLVAVTALGVCSILLGEDPRELERDLARRFRHARITPAAGLEARIAEVVRLIEEPRRVTALPLDIRGTAFQRRVWEALTRIPAGSTRTYAELARSLGAPRSARAVARACAENPLAVAVPCHRVVRTDGELAGYRWGVERKQRLLEREGGDCAPSPPRRRG